MPDNTFQKEHLEKLKECAKQGPGQWRGSKIRGWAEWLRDHKGLALAGLDIESLPDARVSRADIEEMIKSAKLVSIENCAMTILAWGGMDRRYANSAFQSWTNWRNILEHLREQKISSAEAYSKFYELRRKKLPVVMGVAYYTKLIYFFGKGNSYIMDQWTSRSINLMAGKRVVSLTKNSAYKTRKLSYQVADNNKLDTYQQYCALIEALTPLVGYGSDHGKTESLLMSEGYGRGTWRNYVIANT